MEFNVLLSTRFARDFDRLAAKHAVSASLLDDALKPILQADPYNRSRVYRIKKLKDIPAGKGQWCIRIGNWRIRYDISGTAVILHSFKPRPEAYRN